MLSLRIVGYFLSIGLVIMGNIIRPNGYGRELDSSDADFGKFKVGLAELLTLEIVLYLATYFDIPNGKIDQLKRSQNPGQEMVHCLWERGIIKPTDISSLIEALRFLKLNGILDYTKQHFTACIGLSRRTTRRTIFGNRATKKLFQQHLRDTYRLLYQSIQPIPYIRDRLYRIDKVYVESGVEAMVLSHGLYGKGTWKNLKSVNEVLQQQRRSGTRRYAVEGDPGYGKSTLTLQLAYEWCNRSRKSLMKNAEILILLRLRQMGGDTSIVKAIKQYLLPKNSKLNEMEIEDILNSCTSVVIIFDGYDEYPDQKRFTSEVNEIIHGDMYPNVLVIFTTRSACLPNKCPPSLRRLRLTGFDSTAQEQYIQNVVSPRDIDKTVEKIQRMLRENAVIGDLCQVPLFFVMFTHMTHENENIQHFSSVTSFFRYMISCFHGHIRNKMKDEDEKKSREFERLHSQLDELAFQGLSASEHQLVWKKDKLKAQLGTALFEHYRKVGILVEEETVRIHDEPGTLAPQHIQYETEVRFYHKLFCEWYAAHHLLGQLQKCMSDELLKVLDPFDLQYVYRFACGLNPEIGEKIIKYLKQSKEGDKFAILCILEQDGKVDNILDTVSTLCRGAVEIRSNHNRLLQRSIIQLLEIATSNKIQTSCVRLVNCVKSVDEESQSIVLKSGVCYPLSTRVDGLVITEVGREWTDEEVAGILDYTRKCFGIGSLWFNYCLLPRPFVVGPSLSDLLTMNVTVSWSPGTGSLYRLNLDTGRWECYHKGIEMLDTFGAEAIVQDETDTSDDYFVKKGYDEPSKMTEEQYRNLVTKFREMWSHTHWQRPPIDLSDETITQRESDNCEGLEPIPESCEEE